MKQQGNHEFILIPIIPVAIAYTKNRIDSWREKNGCKRIQENSHDATNEQRP